MPNGLLTEELMMVWTPDRPMAAELQLAEALKDPALNVRLE